MKTQRFMATFGIFVVSSHALCDPKRCAEDHRITVSKDTSRPDICPTIQAAVNCAPATSTIRFEVLVSPGIYSESVTVARAAISILGQSPEQGAVVLTWPVPNTAVLNVTVGADDFVLSNMTVYNPAYEFKVGKNFALYVSGGDRCGIYYSALYGAQDTIYTGENRTYFYGSLINGTSDFNYGSGSAVWDSCTLMGDPGTKGWSFITAHAGTAGTSQGDANRSTYLIRNSRLPATAGARLGTTFLGRPWGENAQVIYDNCWLDRHIAAQGWNSWHMRCAQASTKCAETYYAEHNSTGPGANASARVAWSHQLTPSEVAQWTVRRVMRGWSPPHPSAFWEQH